MANKTSAKKTAPQPTTRNQPVRQTITVEAVIARAPHGALAETLSRTFGLDCPDYAAIRYRTSLSERVREMAILIVAAHWHSDFEVYAHEAVGRAAGLSEDILTHIRNAEAPLLEDRNELIAVAFVTELCSGAVVSDHLYDEAIDALGTRKVYELSTLVGYYSTLALQLRLFKIGIPSEEADPA